MKKIAEDSPANKSLSPTNISDVNQTKSAATFATKVEGGRFLGRSGKKHSGENIKIPWQVMERTSNVAERKMHHSNPMATNTVDFLKGSTETGIIGHKRKLSKAEVARGEMSKEKAPLLNDPARRGNEVKAPKATGFDLNNPPIDDEGGEKHYSYGAAYESTVWPTIKVKTEPYIEEYESAMYPPPKKNVGFSPAIMIKVEPSDDVETNEMQPFALEENHAGGDAKILKFDLNEVPVDEGEE